ncbi:MAG: hypothetical protein RIB60_07555 [Phycisphaerales bacterium]
MKKWHWVEGEPAPREFTVTKSGPYASRLRGDDGAEIRASECCLADTREACIADAIEWTRQQVAQAEQDLNEWKSRLAMQLAVLDEHTELPLFEGGAA